MCDGSVDVWFLRFDCFDLGFSRFLFGFVFVLRLLYLDCLIWLGLILGGWALIVVLGLMLCVIMVLLGVQLWLLGLVLHVQFTVLLGFRFRLDVVIV